jgi:hypothetical protein
MHKKLEKEKMKLKEFFKNEEPAKHNYVKLIEYSLENKKFSMDQACKATDLSEKEFRFIMGYIFSLSAAQSQPYPQIQENQEWILKPEIYFSYLQYLEYCDSTKQARRAQSMALFSIVVSLFVAWASK